MIAQDLDDPTIGYPVTRALDHHTLKFGLQGRQAGKTAFNLGKLRFGDCVGCGTGLIRIVGQAEKVADGFEGKAKLAGVSDERQSFMGLVRIKALITDAALGFGQQADLLVVADRWHFDPRRRSQLSNRQHEHSP